MEPIVEIKAWIVPVAALIPLVIGFIWYNPKVLGTAWMKSAGLKEEDLQGGKMGMLFFLSYVFACLIGFVLVSMTIHQMGFQSMVMNYLQSGDQEAIGAIKSFFNNYGGDFRTFKHGSLHGLIAGFTIAFPILATNALFERKGWKYIWINAGYWIVSMTLMGGVVCQFA